MELTATEMERLIGDLLDTAQLEAGRPLDLRREPTDLVELASRCVAAYDKLSAADQLRLQATAPAVPGFGTSIDWIASWPTCSPTQ